MKVNRAKKKTKKNSVSTRMEMKNQEFIRASFLTS